MKKDLYLNGVTVLRIEKNNNDIIFLKVSDNDECMQKVNYTEFMQFFKKLAYVYITSWDTNLINEYRDFNKFINKII